MAVAIAGGCADDGNDHGNEHGTPTRPSFTHVATGPCPDSRFECVTLAVPRDHFSDDPATWDVTFGIRRAAGESRGTFVTITGGPGSSGLALADDYTDYMSPDITDDFDIVFLDQRGIGESRPFRCDAAVDAYYSATWDPSDPAQRDMAIADTQTFVGDCVAEAGVDPGDLPYYSTVQAVEDLEAFREYLGVEQIHLYGESYGTQYAQTYAAAHPDRVAALILDGVVDLTVDVLDYYVEGARAHDDVLAATLAACDADEVCGADAGGDALAAWDELAGGLGDGPIAFEYPLPDGSTEGRAFSADDLEWATVGFVGSLGDRMLLQRGVAAAANGNLVPLARLAYSARYVDPDTFEPVVDPAWSDAMYFAVECQDYDFFASAGSDAARFDAWFAAADAQDLADVRLATVVYGDLPCLAWPGTAAAPVRPAPIVDPPYPTLVLTSDTDPATPVGNAWRVFERLRDASLIVLEGGPHVIFDWGYECVDELVTEFIATGAQPPERTTTCAGEVADAYAGLAPIDAEAYDDPWETIWTIEAQLLNAVGFVAWDSGDVLAEGCDFGGAVEYASTDAGVDVALDACEYTDGYPVTGAGTIDDEGTVTLGVEAPDGHLDYQTDGSSATFTGVFAGRDVDAVVELGE